MSDLGAIAALQRMRVGRMLGSCTLLILASCVDDDRVFLCDPGETPAALDIAGGGDNGTRWEGAVTQTSTGGRQFDDVYVLEIDAGGTPAWFRGTWAEDSRGKVDSQLRRVVPSFGCERTDQFALYLDGTNGETSESAKAGRSWKSRVRTVVATGDYLRVEYGTELEVSLFEVEKLGDDELQVTWFFADIDRDSDAVDTYHIRGVLERVEQGG